MTDDDAHFLNAFDTATLPGYLWTHRAHLRMAFLYLERIPGDIDSLLPIVRARIKAYNVARGKPNGYHETITVAFLRLIHSRLHPDAIAKFADFEVCNPDLFEPRSKILFDYYSESLLFSDRARSEYVPPDRMPLP